MRRRCLLVALLMAVTVGHAHADCSTVDAAERMILGVAKLRDWEAFHAAYPVLRPCDDGDVAEAISDYVVRTLAQRWELLPQLAKLERTDPEFVKWVVRHIDSTTDTGDLSAIVQHVRYGGPKKLAPLRRRIGGAAEQAISQF